MLNLIDPSHDPLEDLLKQELAVINDDLGGKINKLEENIKDLKTLMNTTMESLKGLNKVNASKRKNFSTPGGIFFFESLQARLKQHLAAIALSYDPVLYTALDGCYEIYTANKDRFPLLDKVIAFINNTDKKTLLILAESGFGKTSFSVYLTRYLLNDSFTLSRNYRVLPFYLSLSRITTKNTETTTLESVLQHYYRFTQEEVDLLFENNQLNFCFIFDDVNESNLNMDFIRKICSRFSFSHYIFMAALSEFKSKQACERLLRSSYPGKGVSEEKTIYLAPFNKRAKKNYIFNYLASAKKKLHPAYSALNPESMYQRIKALKGLAEVSKQPVFLMMIVNVFPYLEAFYQQEKIIPEAEAIKKDLFYMYSYLVCKQVTHRAKGGAMNEDHLLNSYAFNPYKILNYFRRVDELVRRAEIQNFIDNYRFLPLSSWITGLNEPSSPATTSSLGFSSEEENACLARSPFSYRCSSSSFFSDENHPLQPRRRHSGQNVDRFEEEGCSLRSHTSSAESEEKKQFIRSRSRTQSPENSRRFFSPQKSRSSYVSSMLDNVTSPIEDLADNVEDVLQAVL